MPQLTILPVDGPLAMWFQHVLDISMTLIVKFCAIVIVTPVFLVPSAAVAIAGGICGQVYIKAQLGVKRQMANAKAPVLAQYVYNRVVLIFPSSLETASVRLLPD